VLLTLASVSNAAAQQPSAAPALNPPRPLFVVDARGATATIPKDSAFYPPLPEDALVPARGFGFDGGAHVYAGRLARVRLGYGADVIFVRATQGDLTTVNATFVAPQVSLNFGTSRGWSYISGGAGVAMIRGQLIDESGASTSRPSGTMSAVNVGGGARWFMSPHLAFTFDIRLHRLGHATGEDGMQTPTAMLSSVSAGFSLKM
jgi:hypothetical protein